MIRYTEALKLIYKCTTFVFTNPRDVHCFQQLAPPQGLHNTCSIILAYGRVDKSFALFSPGSEHHMSDPIDDWVHAYNSFRSIKSLQELQVWLYHSDWRPTWRKARPWKSGDDGNGVLERRQAKLVDLLGGRSVRRCSVDINWGPDDIPKREERSFTMSVRTANEIQKAMHALTPPVYDDSDLYD